MYVEDDKIYFDSIDENGNVVQEVYIDHEIKKMGFILDQNYDDYE